MRNERRLSLSSRRGLDGYPGAFGMKSASQSQLERLWFVIYSMSTLGTPKSDGTSSVTLDGFPCATSSWNGDHLVIAGRDAHDIA